jgi:hypothetical protein
MLGLEESRLELESVWSSVNLLNIVTDKLEMDRFAQVNLNTVEKDFHYFLVLWIRDILVQIRLRGSVPLSNGSGSDSWYFRP